MFFPLSDWLQIIKVSWHEWVELGAIQALIINVNNIVHTFCRFKPRRYISNTASSLFRIKISNFTFITSYHISLCTETSFLAKRAQSASILVVFNGRVFLNNLRAIEIHDVSNSLCCHSEHAAIVILLGRIGRHLWLVKRLINASLQTWDLIYVQLKSIYFHIVSVHVRWVHTTCIALNTILL